MELAPVTEFVSRNWLFTILIGAIGWLWRQVLALQKENAVLEAKISSLEERNTDMKRISLDEVAKLKAENLTLHQTIQNEHSDDAILAKYEFNEIGVAIHKQTRKPHCPACLHGTPRREVILSDEGAVDEYLRCPVEKNKNHYYKKIQQHRHREYPQPENPYRW